MQSPESSKSSATADFTLSLISHRQGALVSQLLADLARLRPAGLARVVVTRNLPEAPIDVPPRPPFAIEFSDNPVPRGFGANHNAAFARCAEPWFVVANPDIRLAGDPFPALFAAATPRTGLVAPAVLDPQGHTADSARALITPVRLLRRLAGRDARRPDPGPAWFAGMFLAIRSQAFASVGGFDERYFMYCEDADLCARLRLEGWSLQWAREARVVHDARRASRGSIRHAGWHAASLLRMWSGRTWWRYRELLAAERRPGAQVALER